MLLDLKKKCISVKVNNGEKNIVFDDILIGDGIEYCMAVTLQYVDSGVQLLDYFET